MERDWHNWTDWRWTGTPISTIGGLHGSLLAVIPLGIILSALLGVFWSIGMPVMVLYTIYLIYCRRHRRGPYTQLIALYVQHVTGCQWGVRR